MNIDLKGYYKDRQGQLERRFCRIKGRGKIRIRAAEGTPEFFIEFYAARERLAAGMPQRPKRSDGVDALKIKAGSLRALAVKYFASRDFLKLESGSTRRGVIEACLQENLTATDVFGDMPARIFDGGHMHQLMKYKEDDGKLGAANNRKKYFSAMLTWAAGLPTPLVARNAAADAKKNMGDPDDDGEGFHTWSEGECRVFEAFYPVGTKPRLCYEVMYNTGMRPGDAVTLGRQHVAKEYDDEGVERLTLKFRASKGKHRKADPIQIDFTQRLQDVIAASPMAGDLNFIQTDYGQAYSKKSFYSTFSVWCSKAGLPECTAHGIRKNTTNTLLENDATEDQAMAQMGWTSRATIESYKRKINKRKLTRKTGSILDAARSKKPAAQAAPEQSVDSKVTRLPVRVTNSSKKSGA